MDIRFDNTFKLSSTALYLNLGHPSLTINLQWATKMFMFYVLYTPSFLSLIYSSIFYDSFTKSCTNLSLATLYCINIFNYVLLIVYKKRFIDIIKMVEEDLLDARELIDEDEKAVKEFTAKGIRASKLWASCCALCGVMFFCKSVIGTSYSVLTGNFKPVAIHELTYPPYIEERKNGFLMYIVIFVSQTFYIVFTTLMYAGFNVLGPIFIMHACGQIQVAIQQLDRLFMDNDIDVDDVLKKLKNITHRLQHINSFVDQIRHTHQLLYEMCLKTSISCVAISSFAIIESYKEGSLNIHLICFSFAALMQSGIPCYYSEVLLGKGEELRVAIYECGWERFWIPKSRSIILVLLTRNMRPLGIYSVFSIVSLKAFADEERITIPFVEDALSRWTARYPTASLPEAPRVQRLWDDVGAGDALARLMGVATGVNLARLKSVSNAEAGAWLQALPAPHLGTLLDNDSLRVAVALRLGCDVCVPHKCICSSMVEATGHHALSCCRCSGRFPRHHALNDIVRRALISANIPCVLEPPDLCRTDGRRPDGLTLVPWQRGKCLLWDATCVSTFAASHLGRTVRTAGAAADFAAVKKRDKYANLASLKLYRFGNTASDSSFHRLAVRGKKFLEKRTVGNCAPSVVTKSLDSATSSSTFNHKYRVLKSSPIELVIGDNRTPPIGIKGFGVWQL
ncbi:uncharacterized protein LOC134656558 [Cydia amplana]|uniref:uncharacterized protein LOC134656558 n=1 Tax=Cydia amplana TaxID=1869771 RepID=UPI002FE593ED